MATFSLDLRKRILKTYDRGEGTREQIAQRFDVSVGMVKKLLQQRRRLKGDITPQHSRSGRKPKILASHREAFQTLLTEKPDLTLAELRQRTGLDCTEVAIHYALVDLNLTYKKRLSTQPSRTVQT